MRTRGVLQVLAWSAYAPDDFWRPNRYVVGGGGSGKTEHTVFDPATSRATSLLVANTEHDMFCPGISMMHNGDILVTVRVPLQFSAKDYSVSCCQRGDSGEFQFFSIRAAGGAECK